MKPICEESQVCFVYFTVPQNLSESIIVNFHSATEPSEGFVYYTQNPNDTFSLWTVVPAKFFKMEQLTEVNRFVFWADLFQLQSNSIYYIVAGFNDLANQHYLSKQKKIRTAGSDNVTFISGGDVEVSIEGFNVASNAAKFEPLFASVGGDISYANAFPECYRRWDYWFINFLDNLQTPTGFSLPLIVALGNHEAGGDLQQPVERAFYFLNYFPQQTNLTTDNTLSRPLYHSHLIGDNLVMVMDSGIIVPMIGEQSNWMISTLEQYENVTNKFPVYHYGLYPAVPAWDLVTDASRLAWIDIFDRYGVRLAFENHYHVYKRTKALYNNQEAVNGNGTIYLGDGSWGILGTSIPYVKSWFMDQIYPRRSAFVIQTGKSFIGVLAVDDVDIVFDQFNLTITT